MYAELTGAICSGAIKGKLQTYALLEERAPQVRSMPRDEALAELTGRYFTSHGPATVDDFSWWSSLTIAEIKKGLTLVGSSLTSEVVDGRTYWFAARPIGQKRRAVSVYLLQGYDEYIVGYRESKWLLALDRKAPTLTVKRSVPTGIVLLDSQVAGHWKRCVRSTEVWVEAAMYEMPRAEQMRALQREADRYAHFFGLSAKVQVTQL